MKDKATREIERIAQRHADVAAILAFGFKAAETVRSPEGAEEFVRAVTLYAGSGKNNPMDIVRFATDEMWA